MQQGSAAIETDSKPKKMPDSEFVCKLCDMIERYPDIVGWSEDGKQFLIKDVELMQNTILPQYFRHTNFSSFVRQLNMYDFHKQYKKQNKLSFKNQIFQRGNQRNFHFIQRKRKSKLSENYQQEFMEKYEGLLSKIQANDALNSGVKEVLENLVQTKFTMGKFIGKVRQDLAQMCVCLKDSRSKKVNQIVKELKGKSEKLSECLSHSKRIDAFMESSLSSEIVPSTKSNQQQFKQASFTHLPPFLQQPKSLNDISHLNMNLSLKSSFFNNPNNNSFIFMPSLMGVGGGSGFGQLDGERAINRQQDQDSDDEQGSMSFVEEPQLRNQ